MLPTTLTRAHKYQVVTWNIHYNNCDNDKKYDCFNWNNRKIYILEFIRKMIEDQCYDNLRRSTIFALQETRPEYHNDLIKLFEKTHNYYIKSHGNGNTALFTAIPREYNVRIEQTESPFYQCYVVELGNERSLVLANLQAPEEETLRTNMYNQLSVHMKNICSQYVSPGLILGDFNNLLDRNDYIRSQPLNVFGFHEATNLILDKLLDLDDKKRTKIQSTYIPYPYDWNKYRNFPYETNRDKIYVKCSAYSSVDNIPVINHDVPIAYRESSIRWIIDKETYLEGNITPSDEYIEHGRMVFSRMFGISDHLAISLIFDFI